MQARQNETTTDYQHVHLGLLSKHRLAAEVNSTTRTGLCDTTKEWSDDETDTLTNSFLQTVISHTPQSISGFSESTFGDTANFEVNALHSDACSSFMKVAGPESTSCSKKLTNVDFKDEHKRQ